MNWIDWLTTSEAPIYATAALCLLFLGLYGRHFLDEVEHELGAPPLDSLPRDGARVVAPASERDVVAPLCVVPAMRSGESRRVVRRDVARRELELQRRGF